MLDHVGKGRRQYPLYPISKDQGSHTKRVKSGDETVNSRTRRSEPEHRKEGSTPLVD